MLRLSELDNKLKRNRGRRLLPVGPFPVGKSRKEGEGGRIPDLQIDL